jgi:hypothetical protein
MDETNATPSPTLGLSASAEKPRFADSYGLVLLFLVASYFASAIGGDNHWGRVLTLLILATTTWLALRASQVQRRLIRLAMGFIPVATAIAVVTALLGSDTAAGIVSATLTAILVVVAPPAIAKRLATHPTVNANTFYGAVCIYLLIAMFFAAIFFFVAAVTGEPFFAQLGPSWQVAHSVDYLYFSFTTITTVGYGDLTAQADVGRMLAVSEAILGQLYLITVVALVVQNLSAERRRRRGKE